MPNTKGKDTEDAVAADIVSMRKRRRTYKGFITKTVNWFHTSGQAAGFNRLEVELESLVKNCDQFAELEVELISLDPDVDAENPGKLLGEVDFIYCDIKAKIMDATESKRPKAVQLEGNVHNHSLLELSSILNANRKNLPKLDLPKFDGEVPEDFLDFIHTFDSMVHNADLEPLDKFRYLKSCLSGKAKQIIAQLDILPNNYCYVSTD